MDENLPRSQNTRDFTPDTAVYLIPLTCCQAEIDVFNGQHGGERLLQIERERERERERKREREIKMMHHHAQMLPRDTTFKSVLAASA